MPINNNVGGTQNIGVQQSNESGSDVTTSPNFYFGHDREERISDQGSGGPDVDPGISVGTCVGAGGLRVKQPIVEVPPSLWQKAHAEIQTGWYYIRNINAKRDSQLVVRTYNKFPHPIVEAFKSEQSNKDDDRKWEIVKGGGDNSEDLYIVSRRRTMRYLTEGPHVSEEPNIVRMIPVPNKPGCYYISPNMSNPPYVIMDPNIGPVMYGPATMILLSDIEIAIPAAQWKLIPAPR